MDFNKLNKKAQSIIQMATQSVAADSKMPTPKDKPRLTDETRVISLQVINRDLYLRSRELLYIVKNIIRLIIEDLHANKISDKKIEKMKTDIKAFKHDIDAANSLADHELIVNKFAQWKTQHEHFINKYLDKENGIFETINQCSEIFKDFKHHLNRLAKSLLQQVEELESGSTKKNKIGIQSLLKTIKKMLEGLKEFDHRYIANDFEYDFGLIAKAYRENQFNIKKIHALGMYLNHLIKFKHHDVDLLWLTDLNAFNSLLTSFRFYSKRVTSNTKFNNSNLFGVLNLSLAITELESHVSTAHAKLSKYNSTSSEKAHKKRSITSTHSFKFSLDLGKAKSLVAKDASVEMIKMPNRHQF